MWLKSIILVFALTQVDYTNGKPDYQLDIEEFITFEEYSIITFHYARMQRFNFTATALNVSFTLHEDLDSKGKIHISVYEKMPSGRFSMLAVRVPDIAVCDLYKEKRFFPQLLRRSNYPRQCPFTKGDYWLSNFTPDSKSLPDRLPGQHWKAVLGYSKNRKLLFKVEVIFFVNRASVFN